MKSHSRTTSIVTTVVACLLMAASAHAVTISASSTAPLVDGADIANLSQATAFEDFSTSFLWPDRPARGQTFTTGTNSYGYLLDAITVQANAAGGNTATAGSASYTLRVGTVSGTTFTTVAAETASFGSIGDNDYVTYLLSTPIELDPSTLYGFDIGMRSATPNSFSTVGWELRNNTAAYADGRRYSSGANGVGGATVSLHNPTDSDRIFHANLTAIVVPEPATATLALVGLGGVMLRRRREA